MAKADPAAEPSMEDLLATIRKAINEDVGLAARSAEGRNGEIQELRNKVAGQLSRTSPAPRREVMDAEIETEDPPLRRGGFAGLLGGEEDIAPPAPRYSEPERPRYRSVEPDYQDPPRMWQPEPAPTRYLPPPAPGYRPAYGAAPADPLLGAGPSAQANAAFNQLAETLMARALGERSIEQMTQELLRAMLKQWLDDNLPALVERLVREEIERVARRGGSR